MNKYICIVGTVMFLVFGVLGLDHAAKQQRDVARKHGLEDLEEALFRYADAHGTYPPEDESMWCGRLSDPEHHTVQSIIETTLREGEGYQHPAKSFPTDPIHADTPLDYAYWKTSPMSFELVSVLEADTAGSRSIPCADNIEYHYRIESTSRRHST